MGDARVHPRLDELGQPEVEDLDEAVARDHQVLGLEVAVNDAGSVRLGRPSAICTAISRRRFVGTGSPEATSSRRVFPLDELHRDVRDSVRLADVVDGQDVRMVERRGRARLLLEALTAAGVGGQGLGQHLDRDLAPEPRVPRPIHLAHAAGAERREDLVRIRASFQQRAAFAGRLSASRSRGRGRSASGGKSRRTTFRPER